MSETLCYTTNITRLISGNFITIRVLPSSSSNTTVECSFYLKGIRSRRNEEELERARREIQRSCEKLEKEQQELMRLNGNHRIEIGKCMKKVSSGNNKH